MTAAVATDTVLAAIEQALTDMGGTADAVADTLRARGIKGRIGAGDACPLARALHTIPGAEQVRVSVSYAWLNDTDTDRAELTNAAKRFRLNFDRGVYLDLVDQHAPTLQPRGGWQEQTEGGARWTAPTLVYEKYGTRIAASDEGDDRLLEFAFDGAKAMAESRGWELLPGPVERVYAGTYDEDDIYAYLWPVVRPGGDAS